MAYTDPPTFVANNILTAAQMNTYLRDNFKALADPWTAYTPTWTALTTNPSVGNGTLGGAYMKVGRFVHFRIKLTTGSTTTYGSGAYRFALPTAITSAYYIQYAPLGGAMLRDDSVSTKYLRHATAGSTSTVAILDDAGVDTAPTVPFTFAVGDTIVLQGFYESAT